MDKLIQKRLELLELIEKLNAIQNRTDLQNKKMDSALAEFSDVDRQIKAAEIENAMSRPQGRRTAPVDPSNLAGVGPRGQPRGELDQWVLNVAKNPSAVVNAQTTYAGEGTAADGGYLTPAEYSRTLDVLLKGPQSILSLCDNITTISNSIVLPTDEDPPWSAAGIAAADVAEGAAYTAAKPVLKNLTITLAKTGVLVPVSDELLADGVGIGDYIARKSADKLTWALNAKAMTAFLASGAKITTAKTTGAAAGSPPDIDNVLAMFENIPAAIRDDAVWFANPRLQTKMLKYLIGQVPVFVPGGSLANAPHDMLLGKRVIWSELCAAVGTVGDLVLVAPKAFYCVTKGAPQAAVSTHLYFDQDITAYKCSARVKIASKFQAVITRPDSTTVGNVCVLATRA